MEKLLQFFTPITYNLDLEISRETETIKGEVQIYGQPHADVIKFHAVDMEIKSVSVRKFDEDLEHLENKSLLEFTLCDFTHNNGEIEIKNPDHAQNPKDHILNYRIVFETKINQNLQGCYLSSYKYKGGTKKIVTTQFESHYARECFPCIDEPAAKAKFNLLIRVPDLAKDDVVLANTEVREVYNNNEFVFETTPRMSTYLLAWVIGSFQKVSGINNNGVKVTSYAALNQTSSSLEFANEVAMRALEYYDEKFGIKYPLAKLDQVALPDFEAGAMENWGLVTYRESCMLAEPNSTIDTKQSVAITVTHELSHQWFGDLVTMDWWDDLWLNESFATIMEYFATDTLYPEFKAWQDFYTGECIAALRRDCLPGVQSVQQAVHDPAEIATLFDSAIVYAKGARLVLMLMGLMGEDNFYRGVQDYFQKYQYQNAVGDDLWNCLQPYADFEVKDFMYSWISQPGYPSLQFCQNGDYTWWAQQRLLINGTTDDSEWKLPEVKDDMSGHYVLDLSEDEIQEKLLQFDQLDIAQRLRLLIDRMILAKAGVSASALLVDLLPKFVNEDAPVWGVLLMIINDLKIFFPYDTEEDEEFHKFLRHIIYSRAQEVGVSTRPGEGENLKRLRAILMVIARFARDMDMIQQMADLYNDDLSKIDAEVRGNVLMSKMIVDEDEIYSQLLQKYQETTDPEIRSDVLDALASARSDEHIETSMSLLTQPEIVRPQDHLFLYFDILRNEKARARGLKWLYQNWDYVEKSVGEKSVEDYPRIMATYINTREEAEEYYQFFDKMRDNPVLKRTLEMAKASIEAKLGLIKHERESVIDKVKSYNQELK